MRRAVLVTLLVLGCRRHTEPAPATTVVTVSDAAADADAADADAADAQEKPADPVTLLPASALVAAEAWALAAPALEASPDKTSFAARVARARVGVGLCTREEGARARTEIAAARLIAPADKAVLDLLARLEVDAFVCAERWAEALAAPAPHGLRARKGALAARTLARALEATDDLVGARAALGEALVGAAHAGLDRGKLLVRRLAVLRRLPVNEANTAAMQTDLRTLYVELPSVFEKLSPAEVAPVLRGPEWLRRGEALAALGRADDALVATASAATAQDPPKVRAIARAKGKALYRAKAYARAVPVLEEAAALGGADDDAVDDAFHAARARSRAGDDDAAITAYEALATKHHAGWGAEAAFLSAQLRYLHGRWADAIAAFDRYLAGPWAKAPKQDSNVREARRARALALLASGKSEAAEKAFTSLLHDAHDPYTRARISLLSAIARETAGDTASARKTYGALSASHPYSFVDLAARRRSSALGEPSPPLPTGPIARSIMPTLPAPFDALAALGLRRDIVPLLTFPAPDRCAAADALDDGATAYKLGAGESGPLSRCAWPSPWDPVVAALEAREQLPRGLIHSILRQESAFILSAVSPAGAIGVAQLMPATAAMTAARLGRPLDPDDIAGLQAPYLQLELSARHLGDLYRELAGKDPKKRAAATALVVAAYNAGAAATRRWIGEAGALDADVFVERIPFLETRLYVVRVMANLVRYSILSGAPVPVWPERFTAP